MSEPFVTLDLHGCTADQARVKVDAALRRADRGTYQIRCVHGFHGGTVIRDTLQYKYRSHPKVKRIMPGGQPGCDGAGAARTIRSFYGNHYECEK